MNQLFLFRRQMTPIRKLLLMHLAAGGKLIEYTATGNPMSFVTDVIKPLVSLSIPWTPTQSGTGDPSPTNVRPISGVSGVNVWRTGTNLIDDTKRYSTVSSVYIGNTTDEYSIFLKAGIYTFSCEIADDVNYNAYIREKNGTSAQAIWNDVEHHTAGSVTLAKDGIYRINIYKSSGIDENKVGRARLVVGSSPGTYSPYTGETVSVAFPALGKNLFDFWANGYWSSTSKAWNSSSSGAVCKPFRVKAGTIVTISQTNTSATYSFQEWSKSVANPSDYTSDDSLAFATSSSGQGKTYTVQHDCYLTAFVNIGTSTFESRQVQLEKGETATTYEPFTNTVYGGSLNLTTGVLTATHKSVTFVGADSENWIMPDASRLRIELQDIGDNNYRHSVLSNIGTFRSSGSTPDTIFDYKKSIYYYQPSDITTVEAFKTWLSTHNLQAVYELAEPLTWQLTPQQIQTLIGANVIWTDTNGTNEAVYLKKG